jgi:hypothetical protein
MLCAYSLDSSTVAMIALVDVSTIFRSPVRQLATYSLVLSAFNTAQCGPVNPLISARTVYVPVSMIDTVSEYSFGTYAIGPDALTIDCAVEVPMSTIQDNDKISKITIAERKFLYKFSLLPLFLEQPICKNPLKRLQGYP